MSDVALSVPPLAHVIVAVESLTCAANTLDGKTNNVMTTHNIRMTSRFLLPARFTGSRYFVFNGFPFLEGQ